MSLTHGSFTVEHRYDAPPSRVFRAWSDPDELVRWAAPAEGWDFAFRKFDFRIDGGEVSEFGPPGEQPFTIRSRYDDIVPDRRIIAAYGVSRGETRISSSVMCVELAPDGDGTILTLTEHGAFFDGHDDATGRRGGVLQTLAQLQLFLALQAKKAKETERAKG